MSRLVPDSLGGRVIALLFGGLIFFHIGSLWVYQNGLELLVSSTREQSLIDRAAVVRRTITSPDPQLRDQVAHSLSRAGLDVHWTPRSLVTSAADTHGSFSALRARLKIRLPEICDDCIRIGYLDEGPLAAQAPTELSQHVLLVSLQLPDGSWVNVAAPQVRPAAYPGGSVLVSVSAMGLGIAIVAAILVRSLAAPLRALAQAAQRHGVAGEFAPIPEVGPREVRVAARAFNQMQARIRRLIDERTQALAAVSHDLKTPITRLRLRAEFVADPEIRQKVSDDLDEMESMIDATLAFLRDEVSGEPAKVTDVAALLQTLCNDQSDAGGITSYDGPGQAPLLCRGTAVKRAMANIIGNAIKYGGEAIVALRIVSDGLRITVDDRGPGIPADAMEQVFQPFYRLESSRNVDTGGYGLGLTFARSVARSHGGDIVLQNRPGRGLRVTVMLPKPGPAKDEPVSSEAA